MNFGVIIILILIGLFAGVFGGFVGLGGGVIMIPAMVYILGMSQHMAQGTSLAVMLPPIGILAAYNYWKAGELNMNYAMIIAASFIIGGYFGSKFALQMPVVMMKKIFAFALIIMAVNMLIKK
jgi:uncharacterized membrane protein YfcA